MNVLKVMAVVVFCCTSISGQHYITLGLGGSGMKNTSADLDRFAETYNTVNGFLPGDGLEGFGWSLGIRPEAGYRYFGKWNAGVVLGYQSFIENDFANFAGNQQRRLEIRMTGIFADFEFGIPYDHWLFNGVGSLYFFRKTRINSTFSTSAGMESSQTLDGIYDSGSDVSFDLGISAGYFKNNLMVLGKITVPVYTGGSTVIFTDDSPDKVAINIEKFPDDYFQYAEGTPYKGVSSDVDGMKIILTLVYAIGDKRK